MLYTLIRSFRTHLAGNKIYLRLRINIYERGGESCAEEDGSIDEIISFIIILEHLYGILFRLHFLS